MTEDWSERILAYKNEEPIVTILAAVNRPGFVIDDSIHKELQGYFLFIQKEGTKVPRSILGPGDYPTISRILDDLQPVKDRAAEVLMAFTKTKNDLRRLHDLGRNHLILKSEVINLKNEAMRTAVVAQTLHELEIALSKVEAIIESAEILIKTSNQTYNIVDSQLEAVKQSVYWRQISIPEGSDSSAGKISSRRREI